jgi:hypothetical protein
MNNIGKGFTIIRAKTEDEKMHDFFLGFLERIETFQVLIKENRENIGEKP